MYHEVFWELEDRSDIHVLVVEVLTAGPPVSLGKTQFDVAPALRLLNISLTREVKLRFRVASCGLQGYKPELRAEYFFAGIGAHEIRRLFDELARDEFGLCSNCSAVFHKNSK
jgi:hypothetical protein